LPDLPTISEQGVPGYVTTIWLAFFVPAKPPGTIVDKMNQDLRTIMQRPDVKERFNKLGLQAVSSSTQELDSLLKQELAQWSRVVRDANIKPE
jgi:tripartite-type tricarboxylate transporter receptor subunit TctC